MKNKNNAILNVDGQNIAISEEYYLNNKNLPKPSSTYEYTPYMINEMKKCKEDIVYFATKYFKIIDPRLGKTTIKLYPKQEKILRTIQNNKKIALITSRQWGKCFCIDTQVVMRLKWLPFIKFKFKIGTFYKLSKLLSKFKLG